MDFLYYEPFRTMSTWQTSMQNCKVCLFHADLLAQPSFSATPRNYLESGGAVQDRTIYEDAIFAKTLLNLGLLDERDYRPICLCLSTCPILCVARIIHLFGYKPETSFQRIQMRSRDVESGITMDYLEMLYQEYEVFIEEIGKTIPVIRVPWEEFVLQKTRPS